MGTRFRRTTRRCWWARAVRYAIVDLPTGKLDLSERLNLSDLKFNLDREAEWKQIYNECWRQMRDFFYAPNMHGVDWEKVRKKL